MFTCLHVYKTYNEQRENNSSNIWRVGALLVTMMNLRASFAKLPLTLLKQKVAND